MRIARLKRRADTAEADARNEWHEFRMHSDRSLAIVRRRVGSPAGLAISFSIGFIAGSGGGPRSRNGASFGDARPDSENGDSVASRLAHGPLGDTALKLGAALLARSLTKFMDGDGKDPDRTDPAPLGSGLPPD